MGCARASGTEAGAWRAHDISQCRQRRPAPRRGHGAALPRSSHHPLVVGARRIDRCARGFDWARPATAVHQARRRAERSGAEPTAITLHVGYGTFQPVRVDQVETHTVDAEFFSISEASAGTINRAKAERRRVVAVGTTTTRA